MDNFSLWGAIVNALAAVAGSLLGLLIKLLFGQRKKERKLDGNLFSDAILKGIGLCVLIIGVEGALKVGKILVMVVSVALGALIGTLLDLDGKIIRLGNFLGKKSAGRFGNVSEGFVSATLLFCIGAMAITGPLESGLLGNHTTQYAKAMIDGVTACVLATSLGIGVMFSAGSILLYQGTITLLAVWAQPVLTDTVINEMSAVGSLLIIGIGFNMLGMTKLKLMNYVPAIFLPILLCLFM